MSQRLQRGERPAFLDTWPPIVNEMHNACNPTMIVFYRGFWCDYCRKQLADLQHQAEAFRQRGVGIIAITTNVDPEYRDLMDDVVKSFPVLIDAGGELISRLDLVDPFEFRAEPVSFPAVYLLDAAGVVRFHYVGQSPDDRPRVELLLLAAEQLTTGKN